MGQQLVHLFVFDSMADWEPAFAIAGINNPRFQRNPWPLPCGHRRRNQRPDYHHGRRNRAARHHLIAD